MYMNAPSTVVREGNIGGEAEADLDHLAVREGINVRRARGRPVAPLASTHMASVDVEHDLASEYVRITRRP